MKSIVKKECVHFYVKLLLNDFLLPAKYEVVQNKFVNVYNEQCTDAYCRRNYKCHA
jgi:hypothetical protein